MNNKNLKSIVLLGGVLALGCLCGNTVTIADGLLCMSIIGFTAPKLIEWVNKDKF